MAVHITKWLKTPAGNTMLHKDAEAAGIFGGTVWHEYKADGPTTFTLSAKDQELIVGALSALRRLNNPALANGGDATRHNEYTVVLSKLGVAESEMD